jgi:hypothetical protein
VTGRFSADPDIVTRHIEVFELKIEDAIFRDPFKTHARRELRSNGCWAT